MKFDPELAPIPDLMPEIDVTDPVAARVTVTEMLLAFTGGEPIVDPRVETSERTIPGPEGAPDVKVRLYKPREAPAGPLPCYVHFHGGGFILGDLETSHPRMLKYCGDLKCFGVSVDYRLAPEHPFPAGPEDCYAALRWTVENADELGIDPDRVAIGGDSAGAAFAAAVTLMARDRGGPRIALQVLTVPVTDDRMETPSMKAFTDTPVWDAVKSGHMWRHYLGEGGGEVSPYAAPNRATDLSGLPAAYVMTAEYDSLRDEGIDYAQRLMAAGVPVELHVFPGTYHSFDVLGAATQIGIRALDEQVRALERAFAPAVVAAAQ
jgi:acetyl esterase/lipase